MVDKYMPTYDAVWTELKKIEAENARLNKMRLHCEHCGGDYLATGIETGCPCKLRAENTNLKNAVKELLTAFPVYSHIDCNCYFCKLSQALKGSIK